MCADDALRSTGGTGRVHQHGWVVRANPTGRRARRTATRALADVHHRDPQLGGAPGRGVIDEQQRGLCVVGEGPNAFERELGVEWQVDGARGEHALDRGGERPLNDAT